jgi:hypothetical protein
MIQDVGEGRIDNTLVEIFLLVFLSDLSSLPSQLGGQLGFLDKLCELGPCDRRDFRLGVLSFNYSCVFFIPQVVNLVGFGWHNQRYQCEKERDKKETSINSPF